MSVHALITGSLFRAPEARTAKTGRPYASATIRIKGDEASLFVRVTAFSESAQAEIMRLQDGDVIAVQGPLKAEIYTASDAPAKVSLSLVADHVLALRQPPRERMPKAAAAPDNRTRQERCAGTWQSPADGPNDDMPF